jgi:rhodanese-related sulfurtransferase
VAATLALGIARPAPGGHASPDAPLAIAPEDLERYRGAGEAITVVDVRPADAYRRGHVPQARSLPLAELAARRAEVPRLGRVVLYGATAEEAAAAYRTLREADYRNVMILAGGFHAWRRVGLPVEAGP